MHKYLIYIFFVLLLASCEEVLDKQELNAIDNDEVWNDPRVAELYLNNLYQITMPGFDGAGNAGLSEEATSEDDLIYGRLEVTNGYGPFNIFTYNRIRRINVMIDQVDKGNIEEEQRNILRAQALFLRAWQYFELIKVYGGIPLILAPRDPNAVSDIELNVPRSPATECINAVVNDLDEAIEYLPENWDADYSYGRITKSAAAAFKGRVLMYYASPQFNRDNDASRWQRAYDANTEAKTICDEAGHGLYPDFGNIFLDEGNEEAIMVRVFHSSRYHGYEDGIRPSSVSNSAETDNNPTWEMVKAFPMADGRRPEDHPGYDPDEYWKNRDPRFYETIAYNGCEWQFDGRDDQYQWSYVNNGQEAGGGNSETGFYVRKSVDTSLPIEQSNRTVTDWIEIRYAEVLLNLAECANETGNTAEAEELLKDIRERAGITAGTGNMYGLDANMSQEEMRDAIIHERLVEFAYENKRHWDLRRRNLYAETLNGTRRSAIRPRLDTAYIRSQYPGLPQGTESYNDFVSYFEENIRDTVSDWDASHADFFEIDFDVELDLTDIAFQQPKYNFYFIDPTHLDKNPNLKQTEAWGDANTFDPLED